jgi:hypothetical protein
LGVQMSHIEAQIAGITVQVWSFWFFKGMLGFIGRSLLSQSTTRPRARICFETRE